MSVQISGLCKAYGMAPVLDNFSLDLPSSGIVCLLGPSGCGKSTLLSVLAGIQKPDSGQITGLHAGELSMVFQEDRLLPWRTALENVSIPCRDKGKAAAILKELGLEGALDKKPGELSGGMCRRVAIGRALARGGSVYLLDEPLKGLDEALRLQVMDTIVSYTKGALVLMVTHVLDEVLAMAQVACRFSGPPLRLEERAEFLLSYNERKNNTEFYEQYKTFGKPQ